ncbi:MAG: hypothetical protein ACI9R3_004572 [Verrucomicrobiales bacterium]|jgi:hypothetical protein
MKVDIIDKNLLEGILAESRKITDIHNSGWRVEIYATDHRVSVLLSGIGGDFECAQLASAFHSAYKHLFSPDHQVNIYRLPTGCRPHQIQEELSDAPLWTRIIEKICASIALKVAYVKSLNCRV